MKKAPTGIANFAVKIGGKLWFTSKREEFFFHPVEEIKKEDNKTIGC